MKKQNSLVFRFWDKVNRKVGDCWEWLGCFDTAGYGLIKESNGSRNCHKTYKAHRLSYMLFYGLIPDGLCILHKCNNTKCVNPEHLYAGTKLQNAHDRDRCGHTITHGKPAQVKKCYAKDNNNKFLYF